MKVFTYALSTRCPVNPYENAASRGCGVVFSIKNQRSGSIVAKQIARVDLVDHIGELFRHAIAQNDVSFLLERL